MKKLVVLFTASASLLAAPVATGQLSLPKTLTAKAKGIRTVYISILDPASGSPMPCAAQKVTLPADAAGSFLKFSLEPASLMMMSCKEIPPTFNLKVKLDRDGFAGPDGAGDIIGRAENVKKGASNVVVTLDQAM